jgi:hypothetical protein
MTRARARCATAYTTPRFRGCQTDHPMIRSEPRVPGRARGTLPVNAGAKSARDGAAGCRAACAGACRRGGGAAGARAGEGDRRPAPRDSGDPDRVPGRRPLPAARRPGSREDAPNQEAGRGGRSALQPDPVHAGPDAVGHSRGRSHRGGSCNREARHPFHSRSDLRQHHSRRPRSTAHRPKRRRRSSRRCRSIRSRSTA